ncbi:MAG: methylenetetrahydrofolate reductase, partial [Gammaproteobacteria bacterium]|nr:methylenetetrahydrofolate reductase [Gammaproteobacteria bacterium]
LDELRTSFDFFDQTQYCYDMPLLRSFLQKLEDLGAANRIFLLIGVGPLRSAKAAEWMRQNVPGIHIPDALITRLRGAADPAREGRNICIELIQEVHAMKGVHGVHVMAYRQEESVAEVIDKSGVLAGRVPWYPGRDRQDPAQSNTADTNTADRVAS